MINFKQYFDRKFLRLGALFIVLILFFVIEKSYQNHALSFHFVDEEDNMVLGFYLLKGEKLYSDLFSHHQPLAYIFSSGVQALTEPNTLYLLVKRHREAVILWSVVWSTTLIIRFGFLLVPALLLFETSKIFLLGHLFLSESLVVYPFAYLLCWWYLSNNNRRFLEAIFLGICFGISFLLLSSLWPVLSFLILATMYRLKKIDQNIALIAGGFLVFLVALRFISFSDYLYNAFYLNLKYYIPMTSGGLGVETFVRSFLTPLLAILNIEGGSATAQIIRVLSVLLLLSLLILFKGVHRLKSLYALIILGLTNIRFVNPGDQGYSGFHLLPWFMALTTVTFIALSLTWKKFHIKGLKLIAIFLLFALMGISVREGMLDLFKPRDKDLDYYINYSRQTDFGQAVKIMKSAGDKLFVVPDEWLIYWQADIDHASRMVNYYAWMANVPEIKEPLYEQLNRNLPTFFYCDCKAGYFGLESFFDKYQRIKKDGDETKLLVLPEKVKSLTDDQKRKLRYYNFSF